MGTLEMVPMKSHPLSPLFEMPNYQWYSKLSKTKQKENYFASSRQSSCGVIYGGFVFMDVKVLLLGVNTLAEIQQK